MINAKQALKYCSEEISLIENYNEAIADQKRTWDIHHRRECDENGKTLFTKKQLIEMNLYENRPASELIFVTRSMHIKIHREMMEKCWTISCNKRSIPIIQFTKDGTFIKEWPSLNEAGRQLKTSIGNINSCLQGYRKSAGGFAWRYKDRLQ